MRYDFFVGYITALSLNKKKLKPFSLPKKKPAEVVKNKFKKNGEPFKKKLEF